MTTVLIDVTAGMVATDKQTTHCNGDDWNITQTTKIRPIPTKKMIFVGAGNANSLEHLYQYYRDNDVSPEYLKGHVDVTYCLIQKFPDGTILARTYVSKPYRSFFRKRTKIILDGHAYNGCISFGSGGSYAIGAYKACKDMVKSIKAAISYDRGSGLGVDVFDLRTFKFLKV